MTTELDLAPRPDCLCRATARNRKFCGNRKQQERLEALVNFKAPHRGQIGDFSLAIARGKTPSALVAAKGSLSGVPATHCAYLCTERALRILCRTSGIGARLQGPHVGGNQ